MCSDQNNIVQRTRVRLAYLDFTIHIERITVAKIKYIHIRYSLVKRLTPMLSRDFACGKCGGNIGDVMERKEAMS